MGERIKEVAFADERLREAYFKLKEGKFEEKQLCDNIDKAIYALKQNPLNGIRVPNRLIPKDYIQKYQVNNLWKYNLPNSWRLLYTIVGDEVKIVSMILEWLSHPEYEKRFGY
ncbi:MAG: hypothetical protein AABX48_02905 [Nanoarchaeota archaeon]